MLHNLGLGALLAATAGAVLIPPAVNIVNDGPVFRITVPVSPRPHHGNPFAALAPSRHAVANAPVFPVTPNVADKGIWRTYLLPIKGTHESLFLNVSTPGGTIQLNDYRLFPANTPDAINTYRVPIKAGQRFKPSEHKDSAVRVTQWSANTMDVQPLSKADELLKIRVSIDSVDYKRVNVQDVVLDAVKRADGSIVLVDVQTVDADPRCARFPLLCRWRSMAANMLSRVRGKVRGNCHKHGMAMGRPGGRISHHQRPPHPHGRWHKVHKHPKHKGPKHHAHKHGHKGGKHQAMDAHAPSAVHAGPKPHHHTPHGQGRHHSRVACVLRKVGRIALHVVLPILVGLLAGVMAYVLGMLIGTALVLMWARVRGRGAYAPIALEEGDLEAEAVAFEKDGFVDADAVEEPLPMYVEVEDKE
jgi:hypothetical protein